MVASKAACPGLVPEARRAWGRVSVVASRRAAVHRAGATTTIIWRGRGPTAEPIAGVVSTLVRTATGPARARGTASGAATACCLSGLSNRVVTDNCHFGT